jgi:hypothetical protein
MIFALRPTSTGVSTISTLGPVRACARAPERFWRIDSKPWSTSRREKRLTIMLMPIHPIFIGAFMFTC